MRDIDSLGLLQRPLETLQLPAMPSPVVRLPCPTTLIDQPVHIHPGSLSLQHLVYNNYTNAQKYFKYNTLLRFILPPLVLS